MTTFAGALTALVTPFRDGRVDETALRELVDQQLAAGIDGLVPCGTTGESVNLSDDEYRQVVSVVVEQAAGRVPVVAGAGSASTHHTVALAQAAQAAGANGLLTVVPYYNRPGQAGLVAHYEAVAGATDLPLVLYNIPFRTGSDLSLDSMEQLAKNPSIVAIKDATGNVERCGEILHRFGDRFALLSGDDAINLAIIATGGVGAISVVSNVAPQPLVSLIRAAREGDLVRAQAEQRRLAALVDALFIEASPAPTKFALAALGRMTGDLRLPLVPPSEASQAVIRKALAGLDLL